MRTEILGRTRDKVEKHGNNGCGYIGKIVSYPGGRYEEAGAVFLDLTEPHCMLVLGKRGTGKSYTLGVILEGFSLLEESVRNRLSIIVVDTMSVFHSLKTGNKDRWECKRMKDFQNLSPKSLDNIAIAIPRIAQERMENMGVQPHMDMELTIPPNQVSPDSWLELFDLTPREPCGSLLLSTLRRMGGVWSLQDLREEVVASRGTDEEKRSLTAMLEMASDTMLFSPSDKQIVKKGKITILDISYLGRIGGLDLRAFVVSHLAKRLLRERTLQTTIEMQMQAGLFPQETGGMPAGDIPLVWLVIDEAHLFLPSQGVSISSQPLIDWIKLGRHPGLSIIMATQEPSALHDTAIRQADLVVSHQITAEPDIIALGKARQSFMTPGRDLPTLVSTMDSRRGLAIVFDDRTRKMEYCIIRPRVTLHTGMDASALG